MPSRLRVICRSDDEREKDVCRANILASKAIYSNPGYVEAEISIPYCLSILTKKQAGAELCQAQAQLLSLIRFSWV